MPFDPALASTRSLALDPIPIWLMRGALAVLFAYSASHKLRDINAFDATLRGYRIIPESWAKPAAWSFPAVELCLVALLLLPQWAPLAGMAGAALLSIYSIAIGTNLARGRRDIDCGCLGPSQRQPLSSWLLARNGLLIIAAVSASHSPAPRTLAWIDGVSLIGGLMTLALLFLAANQLAANAPGLPGRLSAPLPAFPPTSPPAPLRVLRQSHGQRRS